MNSIGKTFWKRWMTFGEIVLAFLVGLFLFAILDLISAGLLLTLVAAACCFAVLAAIHYVAWGRRFSWGVIRQHRYLEIHSHLNDDGAATHLDDFVVELNDSERNELLRLLEHSLTETTADQQKTALRREMFDKLRMFGA